MIKYIKRKDLDVAKYDACIENSAQSRIYAFSWYLDIVADNWDVLVLEDYVAVMPIPWRKKYFVKYTYTPLWVWELGIFSRKNVQEDNFLRELFTHFKYVNLRMNCTNLFKIFKNKRTEKQQHYLQIKGNKEIFANYRSDRKKDLKRAEKADLIENWNDNPESLILLFKNNVGKRFEKMRKKDYQILRLLITTCTQKKNGELLSIYDKNNQLVASGFFVKQNDEITILFSATDLKNRKNGANTFLIDRAIYKYKNNFETFGFGGSSIKSIANYFKSFGAETKCYSNLYYNSLPKIVKLFKK